MAGRRQIDKERRRREHLARLKAYQALTKEEKIARLPKGGAMRQRKRLGVE